MVAELAAVIALHGWPCDSIASAVPMEGQWASVTCRNGEVYEVLVHDDWNWRALERQTRLQPMIDLGKWTGQLTAGDAVSRRRAVGALGDLGADAVPAVPALAQALVDENPFVRQEAAEALGGIGPGAAAAVPALIEALDDPDPGVRKSAAAALAAIRAP
jgi:HEAT repeat protein